MKTKKIKWHKYFIVAFGIWLINLLSQCTHLCLLCVVLIKLNYMTTIYKPTNENVMVLHQGFDIAIVLLNGKQQCIKVSDTTLTKRTRPTTLFGKVK